MKTKNIVKEFYPAELDILKPYECPIDPVSGLVYDKRFKELTAVTTELRMQEENGVTKKLT